MLRAADADGPREVRLERPEHRSPRHHPSSAVVVWVALVAMLLTGLSGIGEDRRAPVAPRPTKVKVLPGARSDVRLPRFSRSTTITNPLLPISQLTQVIQLGAEGGDRVRFEVSLLPGTRLVEWDGRRVPTVVSQLVAYSDGRVAEVATDFYAQADDGAVWHFGEEAANYDGGVLVDREGSWLAGRDGQPGMVMPSQPRPGDVFRSVNAPGQGAEEVTVRSVDQTVEGPRGRVHGALLLQEHLLDGTLEQKTFAPGYGELDARLQSEDELYNVALALPIDAIGGPVPPVLASVSSGAERILGRPGSQPLDRAEVTAAVNAMTEAWTGYDPRQGPATLVSQLSDRLADLVAAVASRRPARIQRAAIEVGHASLDLQLRHRPPAEVDRDRMRLWARQLVADAGAADADAVSGDVVVLEALWARIGPSSPTGSGMPASLVELIAAGRSGDLARAATIAASLPVP